MQHINWRKLNQDCPQARISVAIEAVAADLRHIYVLTNTGDIMTFDFGDSRFFVFTIFQFQSTFLHSRRAEEELDD